MPSFPRLWTKGCPRRRTFHPDRWIPWAPGLLESVSQEQPHAWTGLIFRAQEEVELPVIHSWSLSGPGLPTRPPPRGTITSMLKPLLKHQRDPKIRYLKTAMGACFFRLVASIGGGEERDILAFI